MGKVATSPVPSRESPPLQCGGQNQKWPTCGQSGYVTPAVSGIPTAAEPGAEIRSDPLVGKVAVSPLPSRGSPPLQSRGKIRSGPLVGKVATSPVPSRGSPPLQSGGGGGDQKWPTCGQSGYVICRLGDPHRCRVGGKIRSGPLVGKVATSPLPSRGSPPLQSGGGNIRSGPLVGKLAMSPLPSRGSPPLQSGGQNQKWPTCGQTGYATPAVSGIPTASERGAKSEVAHLWAKWLRDPCRLGDAYRFRAGGKSEVAHLWAKWLRHPCRLGDAHRFKVGDEIRIGPLVGKVATSPLPSRGSPSLQGWGKIRSGPLVGKVATSPLPSRRSSLLQSGGEGIRIGPLVGKLATSPLPSRRSPPLQSGGQNQKWHTCGQSGYVTRAVSGMPTASKWGTRSESAHLWAKWLRHPCRLGDPHRCRGGAK